MPASLNLAPRPSHLAAPRAVLMSAERNCFPPSRACESGAAWYAQHRPTDSPYRYLNSGGMIGPADLIVDMINSVVDWVSPPRYENDQRLWQVRVQGSNGFHAVCTTMQSGVLLAPEATPGAAFLPSCCRTF